MKFVALLSGGKDSVFAMMECVRRGHELVCGANLSPPIAPTPTAGATATATAADEEAALPSPKSGEPSPASVETDSYMYQTAACECAAAAMAECLGVPVVQGRVHGSPLHQGLAYAATSGDEVEDLLFLLRDVQRRFPEVQAVCSGAILSSEFALPFLFCAPEFGGEE